LNWYKDVPLKVSVFAYRLLRNRLPTKDNIVRLGLITHEVNLCVSECGMVETTTHLFLNRVSFGSFWYMVHIWLSFSSVDLNVLHDHFIQCAYLIGDSKVLHFFMHLIRFTCVWILWNERNDRIFYNKKKSMTQLLNKVKLLSFWWLKSKVASLSLGFQSWW